MYKNSLKEKLQNKEKVMGCIIKGWAPWVELCGKVGFDFVFIDAEHAPLSEQDCENLIRAAEVTNIIPLIRVRSNDAELILRYMDIGAMGIIVPGISNKEEAEAAVNAVKYYPLGNRGLSTTRASDYGLGMGLKDYVPFANAQTMVLTVIENIDGVNNIEEILNVEGMDGAIIGTTDLSHSLGVPGQAKNQIVQDAFDKALANGLKTGKAVGAVVRKGETPKDYFDIGCQIVLTTSYGLFNGAAKKFLESGRA